MGYKTKDFPAFFVPKSGFLSPSTAESSEEVAKVIKSNLSLNLNSGILVAVPVPSEQAAEYEKVEEAIQKAIKEAEYKKKNFFQ